MLGNNSRDEPQSASLRRTDLMAREEEMRRRAHSDETRQHHHGNRRKTAQLDLRLPELRRFGGKDKIAEGGKFHATAETTTVDGGDPQAIGSGEPSKDSVKRGEHFFDALGDVISDLRPGGKTLGTCALKNNEIRFGNRAFQRLIQRLHHRNVENVKGRAVKRDPSGAAVEPDLNRFVADGHDR